MQAIEKLKATIPEHLRQYIVDQHEAEYTSEEQAVWRYILRQLKNFLSKNAHSCYVDGLEKTGITVNEIPSIDKMCEKLSHFGWSAVPVSGFIPPAAFMELQSYGILPIASDMRSVDHISYTPAPDIVHEAAGHAPILIDPKFAAYLKSYANVAKKAIISREDLAQYEAIRDLSDIKEHPESTTEDIAAAEKRLTEINNSMTFVSEAALLGRMNWWTAEYGLIGDISNPKIYGAGLLSSIGEAKDCLKDKVKKIPLSVDCITYSYDITEPQPQLFVAQSFDDLSQVLDEMSKKLAYRRGGLYGLEKAIQAETVNTVELNSGLQISGQLREIKISGDTEAFFYRFEGPTQLCFAGHQLEGQGKELHSHGFSSPLGQIVGFDKCLSQANESDLQKIGIKLKQNCQIEFKSGIHLQGKLQSELRRDGCLLVLTFAECTVKLGDQILFDPAWGQFDMAIGSSVVSVFAGPADREAYGIIDNFAKKKVPKKKQSNKELALDRIYNRIRDMRRNNELKDDEILDLSRELESDFANEWLPRLEILELVERGWLNSPELGQKMKTQLLEIKSRFPHKSNVIDDGLAIADKIF